MKYKTPPDLRDKARDLRANQTNAEQALWRRLRNRQLGGLRFRRQAPVGPFIADFLCHERKLIVEIDGGQHAEAEGDLRRTVWLQANGFSVLRFWNSEVLQQMEGVVEAILAGRRHDRGPHPSPPPRGEGTPVARGVAPSPGRGVWQVSLAYEQRYRRRGLLHTDSGQEFLLDLPEATELREGDALELEDGRQVLVRAAPEPLAEVRAAGATLARLAWHVGNRHTPAQVEAERLLIQRDHVIEEMLTRLGASVTHVEEPFTPEGGAYGHGRTHGHSHSHDPQADPNAHIPHRHDRGPQHG